MKVLSNTLEELNERWDDPGVYPSNAGQFPLPSRNYLVGIEGELVLELTPEELDLAQAEIKDFINNEVVGEEYCLPDGVKWVEWQATFNGNILTLTIGDVE
jgi:hypothetical protein